MTKTATRSAPHFLLVGDSTDIPAIESMLAKLPVGAYGQVFVEIASEVQIRPIVVPSRMVLTWLRRDRATREIGRVAPRGELAARAVTAWVAEWMPESQLEHARPCVLWIGCSASDRMDSLSRELTALLGESRLHHPRSGR